MLVSGIFVRFKIAQFYRLIDKLSLNTTIIPMNNVITIRAKCVHGKDSETGFLGDTIGWEVVSM